MNTFDTDFDDEMVRKATVTTKVITKLNSQGREMLGYIVDQARIVDGLKVKVSKEDAIVYLAAKRGLSYATAQNISRGLADLVKKNVILEGTDPWEYYLNTHAITIK